MFWGQSSLRSAQLSVSEIFEKSNVFHLTDFFSHEFVILSRIQESRAVKKNYRFKTIGYKNAQKVSNLLICLIFQGLANFLESYPQTYPQKM